MNLKSSYPKTFCVDVPKTKNGEVEWDKNGYLILVKEYGHYTCFHIAHHGAWKKYLFKAQQAVIEQIYREIEGTGKDGIVVVQPEKKKCVNNSFKQNLCIYSSFLTNLVNTALLKNENSHALRKFYLLLRKFNATTK